MESYYRNQAGTGLTSFEGVRYQKGHGFFGRIIKGSVFPLLKQLWPYLGAKALNTGSNILADVYNRKGLKESISSNLKKTAGDIAEDALVKVKEMKGKGLRRGVKRRKRRTTAIVGKVLNKKSTRRRSRKIKKTTKSSRKRAFDFL
jgi:hypothetical protein